MTYPRQIARSFTSLDYIPSLPCTYIPRSSLGLNRGNGPSRPGLASYMGTPTVPGIPPTPTSSNHTTRADRTRYWLILLALGRLFTNFLPRGFPEGRTRRLLSISHTLTFVLLDFPQVVLLSI